jgi:protein gp37
VNKSRIEWTDYTVNPVKGLCPMACDYCYARAMYKRFKWDTRIRFENWHRDLHQIAILQKPSRIFVGSTIELFGDWIEPQWLKRIFETVKLYQAHTFIFLTKQPQNLLQYSPFYNNVWVGYSATNHDMFINGLKYMSQIKATVKFVSLEPLLDWNSFIGYNAWELLDWVIIGAKSPYSIKTFPKWEWIEKIINDCDKNNTPIFLKNNLRLPKFSDDGGMPFYKKHPTGTMELRQEIPIMEVK